GKGDGAFQPTTTCCTGPTHAITAADLNRDGKVDLVQDTGALVQVMIGNGDGTFLAAKTYATGAGPWAVIATDLDCDGKLDLATANASGNSVSVVRGNGDGTFQMKVDYPVAV